jgi:hypothetical protein
MKFGAHAMTDPNANLGITEEYILYSSNVTIPTAAGNTDILMTIPVLPVGQKWTLAKATFSGTSTLAANDTNYATFVLTNKSNADAAMLLATDVNTTKVTGGSAITAYTARALSLNATAANLVIDTADVLLIRYTGTGTLANTVPNANVTLTFQRKIFQ